MQKKFNTIKHINWLDAKVSFFVVKRKITAKRQAHYHVFLVKTDASLQDKLRRIASDKIKQSEGVLAYDFHTTDLDHNLLALPAVDTDCTHILEQLQNNPPHIDTYEALLGAWLYVARLNQDDEPPLFSVRRVSQSWGTKKVKQGITTAFLKNMLVDLEQPHVFRIDKHVDFLIYEGLVFIADKKNFETALNFRAGMVKNRDDIIDEFESMGLFQNASHISDLIGDHLPYLRKLSQIKQAGYHKNPKFLDNLKTINSQENWGINYGADGKIVANKDNIKTILLLLNNDRLTSQINNENFDVDVKHKLAK